MAMTTGTIAPKNLKGQQCLAILDRGDADCGDDDCKDGRS